MFGRIFWAACRPLLKLGLRWLPLEDPWERARAFVPVRRFGVGSIHDFRSYFERASSVNVRNLEEVSEWLLGCQYATDQDLFQTADFWQHPVDFELLRQGDCEDHALWAWRKLVELGYNAELISGDYRRPDGSWFGHVWVCFEQDGRKYLLESIAKDRKDMVRLLDAAKSEYCPNVGVASDFRRCGFHGYLHTLKRQLSASRTSTAAKAYAADPASALEERTAVRTIWTRRN